MKSSTTERFRKLFSELPADVRQQAREAYRLFQTNPAHPSLQFKKVHRSKAIYSARIDLNYRVLGVFENDQIASFWIRSHADYDKLLARL